jgi:hypothetical protein
MRLSTAVMGLGLLVFVLPVPGTFVLGALVFVAGAVLRSLG